MCMIVIRTLPKSPRKSPPLHSPAIKDDGSLVVSRYISHNETFLLLGHTVRNLHFLSKNSTLISRENCRFFLDEKLAQMLSYWAF